jgi:hypothetical protein
MARGLWPARGVVPLQGEDLLLGELVELYRHRVLTPLAERARDADLFASSRWYAAELAACCSPAASTARASATSSSG